MEGYADPIRRESILGFDGSHGTNGGVLECRGIRFTRDPYEIDTMPRTKSANGKVLSDNKRIFQYWVELRDLTNGSIRNLPLTAIAKIHIPRSKKEGTR
jgi:hypothetical protein